MRDDMTKSESPSEDACPEKTSREGGASLRKEALLALWTNTDITASECLRLDIGDINTEKCEITASGRYGRRIVKYTNSVGETLEAYMGYRKSIQVSGDDKDALFITSRNKRIAYPNLHQIIKNIPKNAAATKSAAAQSKHGNRDEFENLLGHLPPFCKDYFIGIAQKTTELTRINYARDLGIFFNFLKTETEAFAGIEPSDFTVKMLDDVTAEEIERFLFYVTDYVCETEDGNEIDRYNDIEAKSRKLSAISSMYRYFLRKKLIEKNPVEFVEKPKKRDRAIIRLDPAEVANLLDAVESGEGQTQRQKLYNTPLVARDVAILTLFLGTGIRISECTGININDIDAAERAVLITRKGQKQDIVYYGDEVEQALNNYMEVRKNLKAEEGDENALFLSGQNRRISNRAVQKLVKKYAGIVTPLKHITPHKLRSTFGTNLYQETGDIYLVATVLGHKDVNTTRKHYAYNSEDIRINATNKIRLRKEKSDE